MKIAVDLGHGCPPDTGAVGIKTEEEMIAEVGKYLVPLLQEKHEVILVRPQSASNVTHSLYQRVAVANNAGVDLYLAIHFNAFTGQAKGTEAFAISRKGKAYAGAIVGEIVKLGFKDRKIKDGSSLYVVAHTNAPAVLVEGCFCDNKEDCQLFDAEKMAIAIASGINSISLG